jgi:hypothetical protein
MPSLCPDLLQNEFMAPLSCAGTMSLAMLERIIILYVQKIISHLDESAKVRTERARPCSTAYLHLSALVSSRTPLNRSP